MKSPLILLLLLVGLSASLTAQFYAEPFDADLNGWGIPPTGFVFDDNGEAENFSGWGNRSRIRSESEGGAMAFTGPGTLARTISPSINLPAPVGGALYLSFYSYFSSEGGAPRVFVQGSNGLTVDTTLQLDLPSGEETSAGNYHLLSIGTQIGDAASVTIQFELVGGSANFWIIDDVQLSRTLPAPVTFPRYFGEVLTQNGLPFVVDAANAPAVPFELVVDWLPGIAESDRQAFRDMYNPVVLRSCACDRLEVWEMPGGLFFDPNTGQPLGDPLEILNTTLPASGMNKVDDVDLNYYNYNDLVIAADTPNPPLTTDDISAFSTAPAAAVKVAILDTGLDLDHPNLAGFVYRDDESLNGTDDDGDCLEDNPLGWNYVDANNNPDDDNGHGTHVAGIVASNVEDCEDCVVQLIPYKTHDNHGIGTLFASACAVLQAAVYDEADIINCSWGFYGGGDAGILKSAMDTAANYGALIIAAAGNDSLNLDFDPQFPAFYNLSNIIAVSAHDTLPVGNYFAADFSNFSSTSVDIAALGVKVKSSLPGGVEGEKSGTSMAAPAVAAGAARFQCSYPWQLDVARSFLLTNAFSTTELMPFVLNGNRLNLSVLCPDDRLDPVGNPAGLFSATYDTAAEIIEVEALQNMGATKLIVRGGGGETITEKEFVSFAAGSTELISVGASASVSFLIVLETGGSLYTQRLVKR